MKFIHAGGHRLEYKWIHPGHGSRPAREAPVLVFLHEGLGSAALWKNFPDRVAAATGCAALVYSRYGYGRSDRLTAPRSSDYLDREALETLPDLLAALAIRNPVLVGHSDGATIALIHAGAGKWPVRGLVLMAPHVFVEDVTLEGIAQAGAAFETTGLAARLGRHHDDAESMFRGWHDVWLHPDRRRWNIEAVLPGITCPVLLIQGEDDHYGTAAQIEAIGRQVSGPAKTLLLARCGHSPQVDQQSAVIAAIADFTGRLAPQSADADTASLQTR